MGHLHIHGMYYFVHLNRRSFHMNTAARPPQ